MSETPHHPTQDRPPILCYVTLLVPTPPHAMEGHAITPLIETRISQSSYSSMNLGPTTYQPNMTNPRTTVLSNARTLSLDLFFPSRHIYSRSWSCVLALHCGTHSSPHLAMSRTRLPTPYVRRPINKCRRRTSDESSPDGERKGDRPGTVQSLTSYICDRRRSGPPPQHIPTVETEPRVQESNSLTLLVDHLVRVFDLRSGSSVASLYGHHLGVTSVQIDDWKIVSGGGEGLVCVWEMRMGSKLWEMHNRHPVRHVNFNSSTLVTANIPDDKSPRGACITDDDLTAHRRHRGVICHYDFSEDALSQDHILPICRSDYIESSGYNYNIGLTVPYDRLPGAHPSL
nr:PREDICTED: uncharacterized protein LOC104949825 [Notothenia coriiceps]